MCLSVCLTIASSLIHVTACRLFHIYQAIAQINWIIRKKLESNYQIIISGNTFENVVCKMSASLSRHQCVIIIVMTSWHEIVFCIIGFWWGGGGFPGHVWILFTQSASTWTSWLLVLSATQMFVQQSAWMTSTKHQRSDVKGIHQWLVGSHHKGPVIGKAFPYHDDIIKWNGFRVTGPLWGESTGFPSQRASNAGFDVSLNKRLNKQTWRRWFETPSCPLLRHCNK